MDKKEDKCSLLLENLPNAPGTAPLIKTLFYNSGLLWLLK
jgi:hypothetical protein